MRKSRTWPASAQCARISRRPAGVSSSQRVYFADEDREFSNGHELEYAALRVSRGREHANTVLEIFNGVMTAQAVEHEAKKQGRPIANRTLDARTRKLPNAVLGSVRLKSPCPSPMMESGGSPQAAAYN